VLQGHEWCYTGVMKTDLNRAICYHKTGAGFVPVQRRQLQQNLLLFARTCAKKSPKASDGRETGLPSLFNAQT